MTTPPITDNEVFLRLVWSPEGYKDGQFENDIIPKADFYGDGTRGCSVDREQLCRRECVEALATLQQPKAAEGQREVPLLAPLAHADVKSIIHEETRAELLEARPDPLKAREQFPENPAHAQIHAKSKTSKSQAQKLREAVVKKLGQPKTISEHFAATEKAAAPPAQ